MRVGEMIMNTLPIDELRFCFQSIKLRGKLIPNTKIKHVNQIMARGNEESHREKLMLHAMLVMKINNRKTRLKPLI